MINTKQIIYSVVNSKKVLNRHFIVLSPYCRRTSPICVKRDCPGIVLRILCEYLQEMYTLNSVLGSKVLKIFIFLYLFSEENMARERE